MVTVAACQIRVTDGDLDGNTRRVADAVRVAKDAGAELAVFPETCLLGWVNPEAHTRAPPIPGNWSARIGALARDAEIGICLGLAERDPANDALHDAAILVDARGEVVLHHRKINLLSHLMDPPYAPGKDVQAVDTPWGRVGLLICADTFKRRILKRVRRLRLDLLLVPYGWAAPPDRWPGHGQQLRVTVQRTARRVKAPVVGVDCVGEITHGPWRGQTFGGQSVIARGTGTILAVGKDRVPDVVIQTILP